MTGTSRLIGLGTDLCFSYSLSTSQLAAREVGSPEPTRRSSFAVRKGFCSFIYISLTRFARAGIQISNTPGAVDHGTATVALFLIISALRQFWNAQLRAHEGKFKQGTSPAVQNDPENKVLGIVGMGGIGRALAKRALAFDMKIIYHK